MAGPATGRLGVSTGYGDDGLSANARSYRNYNMGTGTVITREYKLPHGAWYFEGYIAESLTVAAASATTTNLLPAGTTQVHVSTKITTTLAGNSVANYDVGVTGSATLGLTNTTRITDGDTDCCHMTLTNALNAAAVGILITPDQTTTSGAMMIVAYFQGIRASTD